MWQHISNKWHAEILSQVSPGYYAFDTGLHLICNHRFAEDVIKTAGPHHVYWGGCFRNFTCESGANVHTIRDNTRNYVLLMLKAFCWMLPTKFAVSSRTTNGDPKHIGGMIRWIKLYNRNVHCTKPIGHWIREERQVRQRGQRSSTSTPSAWPSTLSGWQSLGQRDRNSLECPKMVIVSSVLPIRRTQILLARTV